MYVHFNSLKQKKKAQTTNSIQGQTGKGTLKNEEYDKSNQIFQVTSP